MRNLKALGMSVQINMTIARHNAKQLPDVLELAEESGADALHTFLLVPVGCGVDIAAEQMVAPEEYEENVELVLRPVANRRNRIESHLCAALLPSGATAPRGRPAGRRSCA